MAGNVPDEFLARVVYAQVRSHVFTEKGKKIKVLRGGSGGGAAAGEPGGGRGGTAGMSRLMGQYRRGQGGAGGAGGTAGLGAGLGGFGGDPGSPDGGGVGASSPDGGGAFSGLIGSEAAKAEFIDVDVLDRVGDARLADTVLPLRMAVITASFPYKKQLEQFQQALRLRHFGEVFADGVTDRGERVPQFQFLGCNVERRELGPDGKPVVRDRKESPQGWEKLDLKESYKPLFVLTGGRFEPEDPKLAAVSIPGLVMLRPLQFRENQYPEVATKLKTIQDTLDNIKQRSTPPPVVNPRFNPDNFDPFNPNAGSAFYGPGPGEPGGIGGIGGPGSGVPGKPGGYAGGGGVAPPPGFGGGFGGGTGDAGSPDGLGAFNPYQNQEPQEHCLVRLLDVKIQPGKTYEYRIQVRMANPNYGRPAREIAWPGLAKEKEIVSEWTNPKQQPIVVRVPSDVQVYAVDQIEVDRAERKATRFEPGVQNKFPLPVGEKDRVALQVHNWLHTYNPNARVGLGVGDYVIAERVVVNRGEYATRKESVEVPLWVDVKESFELANAPGVGRQRKTLIDLPFGSDKGETVVVDFERGEASHVRGAKKVSEPIPTEVLLLTPDGKLVARDAQTDREDPERKERYDQWKKRLDEIRKGPQNATAPGSPFGPGGGGPGGPGK